MIKRLRDALVVLGGIDPDQVAGVGYATIARSWLLAGTSSHLSGLW